MPETPIRNEAVPGGADAVQAPAVPAPTAAAAGADDLEPQLKYERLGADVKSILKDASATALCLSEKVLALGTSAGNIHILDYSGNEVGPPLDFTCCSIRTDICCLSNNFSIDFSKTQRVLGSA
jgi:hypothetical protein